MGIFRRAPKSGPSAQPATGVVTTSGPCQRTLRLQVAPEELAPVREDVIKEVAKGATLPGFRKGKVPTNIVEQHFAKSIDEEFMRRATQQAFERTAKAHGLKPVGPFEVSRLDYQPQQGLTLEATVEVEPEFSLAQYRGVPLTKPSELVIPREIDQALGQLADSMAKMVPGKEGEPKQRQVPAIDDELAKDLGLETLVKLREHVQAKLQAQKRQAQHDALEAALCDALISRNTFDVPAKLVEHQTERLTRDFRARLVLAGKAEGDADQEVATFTEKLRTNAQRYVKLGFILDQIAEQEKVNVTQDELVKRLWQLARQWKKDPAEVRKILNDRGLWPSIVSTIRQEKTIAVLLKAATITNGAAPAGTAS